MHVYKVASVMLKMKQNFPTVLANSFLCFESFAYGLSGFNTFSNKSVDSGKEPCA